MNITEKQARSQGDHVEKDFYEMNLSFCLKIFIGILLVYNFFIEIF